MASQQQAMIKDTLMALKKAVKRKACESDSDSSIERNTNRGYKLKRRSRFVRKGQLSAQALGHTTYREDAEHAGFQRVIIKRNEPLADDDGYEIESDDTEERVQEAVVRNEGNNAYGSVRLEQLLAPLTSVIDLPNHPTLSRPFTSKALTDLSGQACDLIQAENAALWKVKPLLIKLQGDSTWAPCGAFAAPTDYEFFTDPARFMNRPTRSPTVASVPGAHGNGELPTARPPVSMDGEVKGAEQQGADGDSTANQRDGNGQPTDDKGGTETQGNHINGHDRPSNYVVAVSRIGPGKEAVEADNGDVNPMDVRVTHPSGSQPINAGFGTLGDGPSGLGLLPDPFDDVEDSDLFIHPLFLAPPSARPDRNLGLPEAEAEDVRRLVQLYVQKQEEICRGATRLHKGLLKADRLRRTVLQWAKAEAHCGPHRDMSDGEDWYDKDEWGLTEDLKKGQDEEEEDTHTTAAAQQQKKTRNRR